MPSFMKHDGNIYIIYAMIHGYVDIVILIWYLFRGQILISLTFSGNLREFVKR